MIRQLAITILLAAITVAFVATPACAGRVGYSFAGTLHHMFTESATIFGVSGIPIPSEITEDTPATKIAGTFSYDTTVQGVTESSGSVAYPQTVDAGFTLNVAEQMLRISINNFKIRVTNNFHRTMPVETVDTVDFIFKAGDPQTPGPFYVNDQPWPGTSSDLIRIELTYPDDTFSDASLPAVLPPTFSVAAYSGLGNNITGSQLFAIASLTPIPLTAGDYNVDGKRDHFDFTEWRGAFGKSAASAPYADGSGDGIIDGADYVILRHGMAVAGSGNLLATGAIPEPASLLLVMTALAGLLMYGRKSDRRHLPNCRS